MKKFVVLTFISLFFINAGFCSEASAPEVKQVDIPLVEPVQIIEIEQVKAPVSFLTEEQLKDLEEKAALPSIEDIQEKAENTLDEVWDEQAAITDNMPDENCDTDDIIELNVNNQKPSYNNVDSTKIKSLKINSSENEDFHVSPQNYQSHSINDEYKKTNMTYSTEKQLDKATFGAKYDTSFTPDEMNQKRTLYTKYNATEKFSVNAEYTSNNLTDVQNQTKGTVSVAPEYKLNKQLSVKNTYSKNINDNSNKEELSLNWNPKKYDQLNINFGAGQVQYDDGSPTRMQMNVGTIYRW